MDNEPDIKMPGVTRPRNLCKFTIDIFNLPKRDRLLVDCRPPTFFSPTALIMLTKACAQRSRKYKKEKIYYRGLSKHSYANNLGFSDALNLVGRPYKQGAFGGSTYVPISQLTRGQLEDEAKFAPAIYDNLISESKRLAVVVSQGRSMALREALERAFCEIMRNAFEHGDTETIGICAQYWPSRDLVEICITDRGIGLATSLSEGKYNIPTSDQEAIYFSLMPGVSSKAWLAKKKRASQKTVWDNAGYGLFFASQLFGSLGHFMIASGDCALYLDPSSKKDYECHIEGTVVSMRLDLANEDRIETSLRRIASKASEVKQRLGVKSLSFASVDGFLSDSEI